LRVRLESLTYASRFFTTLAMHVGQAEIAALEAIRQLGVVQPQQVQDRCLQVVT